MAKDKYSAIWVSHSSMGDYLKCPRAYFLKNVYKHPKTGHKIKLVTPALTLGSVVHSVIEDLSVLPTSVRFKESLQKKFQDLWQKNSGKRGGFTSTSEEEKYKKRGEEMIRRIMDNPGPLQNQAVKIQMELPYFWISEEDNIILCGKIDWLEYLPETDSVHIIDFKTSKNEEEEDSLQLPIYNLLVKNCQKREVSKASYWYLDRNNLPREKALPDLKEAEEKVLKVAKKIKLARQLNSFVCPEEGGCKYCRSMEMIVDGKAEFVGVDDYNADVYIIEKEDKEEENREGEVI
jgi:ATP-dependent helicase/DNAse subunit B